MCSAFASPNILTCVLCWHLQKSFWQWVSQQQPRTDARPVLIECVCVSPRKENQETHCRGLSQVSQTNVHVCLCVCVSRSPCTSVVTTQPFPCRKNSGLVFSYLCVCVCVGVQVFISHWLTFVTSFLNYQSLSYLNMIHPIFKLVEISKYISFIHNFWKCFKMFYVLHVVVIIVSYQSKSWKQ